MYFQGQFQYAICIDLVTTCWDHTNFSSADAIDRQEIIGKHQLSTWFFFRRLLRDDFLYKIAFFSKTSSVFQQLILLSLFLHKHLK